MFAEKKLEKRYEKYVSLASSLVSPQSPASVKVLLLWKIEYTDLGIAYPDIQAGGGLAYMCKTLRNHIEVIY